MQQQQQQQHASLPVVALPMHPKPEPPAFLVAYLKKKQQQQQQPKPEPEPAAAAARSKKHQATAPPPAPVVAKLAKTTATATTASARLLWASANPDADADVAPPETKLQTLERLRSAVEKLSKEVEQERGPPRPGAPGAPGAPGKQPQQQQQLTGPLRWPLAAPPLSAAVQARIAPMFKHLRNQMDGMRAELYAREREDNEAYAKNAVPSWRDAEGRESTHKLVNLEQLLNTEREFISYDTFCDITHHESLLSVLGGAEGNNHRAFLRSSNKETRTFEYVYNNLAQLLAPLATETSLFKPRPEQLLAVAEKLCKYDLDLSCSVRKLNQTNNDAAECTRWANTAPSIDLVNYATGNGKTWATILAVMTEVCQPQLWARFREGWRDTVKTNTVQPHMGLCQCAFLEKQQLTRVVVALIPEQLLGQWETTAKAVSAAMAHQKDMGFLIWKGLNKLERSTKDNPGGKDSTLKEAHELCTRTNKAMLWLVPAKTESAKKTMRAAPDLHIPIRIFDEMSCRTEPKYKLRESRVMKNVIVQATVERLQRATRAQTEHPLRKALGGDDFDAGNTHHAAAFHLTTPPDWLRLMVSKGMASTMPSGIRKVSLKLRLQSLAARVNSSDMNITSLDDLLEAMMKTAGANYTSMTTAQRAGFLQRCRGILGAATETDNQGGTIHARLTKALDDVNAIVAAMPVPPEPPANNRPHPQAVVDACADVDRQKRVMMVMIRMLTQLAQAVCLDPPPECPITFDEIPEEHVGIFPCCTNLFDARHKDALRGRCPMCRAPLGGVIVASQAVAAIVEQTQPPPPPPDPAPPGAPDDVALIGDEAAMLARFKHMAINVKFTMSSKAVAKTVEEYLKFKPRGARILLAFACYGYENEQEDTRKTRELLLEDVPALTSVKAVHSKRAQSVEEFVNVDDANRVLIINTRDRSTSLEGLDLWATGLVVIDRLASGQLSAAKIVQTIGRAMRPQEKTKSKAVGFDAPSPFPAKLVVLLEQSRAAHNDAAEQ